MTDNVVGRREATMLLLALAGLLGGCLLMAGKYDASLDVRRDGRFSFAYTGEIYLAALGKLAEMGREAKADVAFQPRTCWRRDNGRAPAQPEPGDVPTVMPLDAAELPGDGPVVARECTPAELAEQRLTWENRRKAEAERRKSEAEGMRALLGGIDPGDPAAAEEFAARLRKQAGWRKVVYKGDGLYDVDFRIEGRLDRDFAFPTVERLPTAYGFVAVSRRQDGTVRIDAPGLTALSGGAMNPMFSALAMGAAKNGKGFALPHPEGRFVVTTDAAILANNTEEGPKAETGGQALTWNTAAGQASAAPMALLQLSR